MRKFFASSLIFIFSLLLAPASHAASPVFITEPTHRLISGVFVDDELTQELAPNGKLGKLIYPPTYKYAAGRSWFIDPSVIDEVKAMTEPYTLLNGERGAGRDIALAWLARLKSVLNGATILPIPAGNPSEYWINRLIPHDRNYLLQGAQDELAALLGQNIGKADSYASTRYFSLKRGEVNTIKRAEEDLLKYATYLSAEQLHNYKESVNKILNASLTHERRAVLARDLDVYSANIESTMRLVPGKFTITSTNQRLPVTVVNGFSNTAKVTLNVAATNQRIIVDETKNVVVPPHSKVQVMVPIHVVASGSTSIEIEIRNGSGVQLAPLVEYPINIKVISPIATWITTVAAGILFLAAVLRSVKRLRRK